MARAGEICRLAGGITQGEDRAGSLAGGDAGAARAVRPCVIMKLITAGVTFSAAHTKSPSFSRSSASTTTITRPWRMASTASSMVENAVDILASIVTSGSAEKSGVHACGRTPRRTSW
jgi:hypothetical protein